MRTEIRIKTMRGEEEVVTRFSVHIRNIDEFIKCLAQIIDLVARTERIDPIKDIIEIRSRTIPIIKPIIKTNNIWEKFKNGLKETLAKAGYRPVKAKV